jgi:hypothetical protein
LGYKGKFDENYYSISVFADLNNDGYVSEGDQGIAIIGDNLTLDNFNTGPLTF